MQTVYAVNVQGWGDCEEQYYNCGTFYTLSEAQKHAEHLLCEWERAGGLREHVVYNIEELAIA